jgi:hypothetical protein
MWLLSSLRELYSEAATIAMRLMLPGDYTLRRVSGFRIIAVYRGGIRRGLGRF